MSAELASDIIIALREIIEDLQEFGPNNTLGDYRFDEDYADYLLIYGEIKQVAGQLTLPYWSEARGEGKTVKITVEVE